MLEGTTYCKVHETPEGDEKAEENVQRELFGRVVEWGEELLRNGQQLSCQGARRHFWLLHWG